MSSILLFNDILQDSSSYVSRVVADSSASGAAVAGYPVSNIVDPVVSRSYRRSGIPDSLSFAQVDLTLQTNNITRAGQAALVVAGVRAFRDGLPDQPVPVITECTISSSALGGSDMYQGLQYALGGTATPGLQCATFLFAGLQNISFQTPAQQIIAGGQTIRKTLYCRIRIYPSVAPAANCTIEIGRILMMSGIWCEQESGNLTYGVSDPSEIITAYDGTPYVLRRPAVRTVSGSLRGLRRALVHGGTLPEDPSNVRYVTLSTVNRLAGKSDPVMFFPRLPLRFNATSFNDQAETYASEGFLGLLEQPLSVSLDASVFNATDQLYSASFRIRELAGRA